MFNKPTIKTAFILLIFISAFVRATDAQYIDIQSKTVKSNIDYYVNKDFSVDTTIILQQQVLHENSLKPLQRRRFSYSTSIEKLAILEAYTIKSDGKKIPVPDDNYQVKTNKGKENNNPIFSDRTSITVVFPDLEVNDSIYVKTHLTEKEPLFPGHFGFSNFFWSQRAIDKATVTINLPASMIHLFQSRGMNENIVDKDGRKIITLTYQNPKPILVKRSDFSVWDSEQEAGYAISTFENHAQIAKAYASRATIKAKVTSRVIELASTIIGSEKDKLKIANLLYDWVAKEISYAGNCIGIGAVVPHDTDFILDNRIGDCKDHATLLQALLESQNIESVQALVNASSTFKLPSIPLVSSVNHVITYLPQWDKYIDSTSATTPFDLIPYSIADKPVILVKNHIDGTKIPATRFDQRYQLAISNLKIDEQGALIGNTRLNLKGYSAAQARSAWRNATKEDERKWIEQTFSSDTQVGTGSIIKDDPEPLLTDYNFEINFERPEFIALRRTGTFYISTPLPTASSIYDFTDHFKEEIEGFDVACGNGVSEERISYKLPSSIKVLELPENFEINENYISYSAQYSEKDNVISVTRKLEDRTPGNTCSSQTMNKQRSTLIKINDNLETQVIYKYKKG